MINGKKGLGGVDFRYNVSEGKLTFISYPEYTFDAHELDCVSYYDGYNSISYITWMISKMIYMNIAHAGQIMLDLAYDDVNYDSYMSLYNDMDFLDWLVKREDRIAHSTSYYNESSLGQPLITLDSSIFFGEITINLLHFEYVAQKYFGYEVDNARVPKAMLNENDTAWPRTWNEYYLMCKIYDKIICDYESRANLPRDIRDIWEILRNSNNTKIYMFQDYDLLMLCAALAPDNMGSIDIPSSYQVGSLMQAGIPLKNILKYIGLSKSRLPKDRDKLMKLDIHRYQTDPNIYAICNALGLDIPEAWIQYIGTLKVAIWANNKLTQLSKVRTIQAPGGEIIEFHNHTLLEYVTDNMLTNGTKTSWKKVYKALQEVQNRLINEQLKEYKHFEELEIPGCFKDIRQITNSTELRKEGRLMNHCVSGYARSCARGKSIIFHIGEPAPHGYTFELTQIHHKYKLCQVYGYNNAPVSKKINTRIEVFIEALNNGCQHQQS